MKKVLIALLIILALGGCGVASYGCYHFYQEYTQIKGEKEVLVTQNAQLQSSIDAIGPITTAYTVAAEVYTGKAIQESDLTAITIPQSSLVTGETVLDLSDIVGKYWKVDVKPGTTVTKSVIMESDLVEPVYEQDMTFDMLPLGIEVGDYVDIKISLPYGQTFYVMAHKRIEELVIENYTVKMYMTATELEIWESAMVDYALYKSYGMKLWVSKYVEPGLQDEVKTYYPVRNEIADLVKISPNIQDYSVCVSDSVRKVFDAWVSNVTTEEGSKLMTGVTTEASKINSARSTFSDSGQSGDASTVGDGTTITDMNMNQYIEDLEKDLNDLSGVTDESTSISSGEDDEAIE